MNQLLKHSIATAVAAECLAGLVRPGLAADAFIAGLLHHLGMAIQVSIDPQRVAAMQAERRQGNALCIRELELRHGVMPHEDCVAEVFGAWQMPESLTAATGHHHDPQAVSARHRSLTEMVGAGARIAAGIGHAIELEPAGPVSAADFPQLALSQESFDLLLSNLPEQIKRMRMVLRM